MNEPYGTTPTPTSRLSDSVLGIAAYLTFIPAIFFLLAAPYRHKPFVVFHAIQELGLTISFVIVCLFWRIPAIGFFLVVIGCAMLLVAWLLCILKASQGGSFKLPLIGKFAAEQSGYAA